MESSTLDLPQPFGPTTQVTPRSKFSTVLGANDLKPKISSDLRYMGRISSGFLSLKVLDVEMVLDSPQAQLVVVLV